MSWTDERIDRLKSLWTQGMTASQIADELGGVSRNAVIGRAPRLGLQSRPSPVKPNEGHDDPQAAAAPAAAAAAPPPREEKPAPAAASPAAAQPAQAAPATPPSPPQPQIRSIGPGGFIRQAPGEQQSPIPPAAPRRLVPAGPAAPPGAGKAEPRDRRQDQPARSQREDLQMADRPSRRARFPFLRGAGQSRLSLLRRALRSRLPGADPAPRPPAAAAPPLRRPAHPLNGPGVRDCNLPSGC